MISEKDVKYVASLARIHLSDDEIAGLTKNLEKILHYMEKLNKLDVSGVEPTSHVLPLQNVTRDDVVMPSLDQKTVLQMAVEKESGSFKVPKVIE